ncbi:hypothetical protein KC361_g245 [Hortaea werneckii]|nr:hypothetical protein KC361_g245 [Hortaea werneckii]
MAEAALTLRHNTADYGSDPEKSQAKAAQVIGINRAERWNTCLSNRAKTARNWNLNRCGLPHFGHLVLRHAKGGSCFPKTM